MLKILRWLGVDSDTKEEVKMQPISVRTNRIGMDKNFRVGRVKHVARDRKNILLDVIEYCNEDDGSVRPVNYNLWIYFDTKWDKHVSKDLLGKYVVVGFYMQSFRNKDLSDSFNTVLTCRFFNEIEDKVTADLLSLDLSESRLFVNHPSLKKNHSTSEIKSTTTNPLLGCED
jgi:hypothetical protein